MFRGSYSSFQTPSKKDFSQPQCLYNILFRKHRIEIVKLDSNTNQILKIRNYDSEFSSGGLRNFYYVQMLSSEWCYLPNNISLTRVNLWLMSIRSQDLWNFSKEWWHQTMTSDLHKKIAQVYILTINLIRHMLSNQQIKNF